MLDIQLSGFRLGAVSTWRYSVFEMEFVKYLSGVIKECTHVLEQVSQTPNT
jgi:hypothetical protein